MQCLLFATANTEVQSHFDEPLALIDLLGMPMIERQIKAIRAAGICKFVVVSTETESEVRRFIDKHATEWDVLISHVTLASSNLLEGIVKAQDLLEARFLLASVDQQMGQRAFERLIKTEPVESGIVIGVDSNTKATHHFDIQKAKRVHIQGGLVRALRSGLAEYEAYSTEAYICDNSFVRQVVEMQQTVNQPSFDKVVQQYIKEDRLTAVDIDPLFWGPIDNRFAIIHAEERLLRSVRHNRMDSPIKKYLLRHFSQHLTRGILMGHIACRALGGVAFLVNLLAAVLLSLNHYAGLLFGGIFAFIGILLHVSFEEVALIRYDGLPWYRWFDRVVGKYGECILLIGLTINSSYQEHFGINPILVGALAIVGTLMFHYSRDQFELILKQPAPLQEDMYIKRDVRYMIIILGAILNIPLFALLMVAVLLNAVVIRRLFAWRTK